MNLLKIEKNVQKQKEQIHAWKESKSYEWKNQNISSTIKSLTL